MSILRTPLDQITEEVLEGLRENRAHEDRLIEYKELVDHSRDNKIDFLRHCSAFSNAAGGDLLIGVRESPPGILAQFPGIAVDELDGLKLFLGNLLRDGMEPRIPGIEMQPVSIGDGTRIVLVVRVLRSLAGPHAVTLDGHWRFYYRTAAGASEPMDVMQVREAFGAATITADRIRAFRADRLATIASGQTPIELPAGPKTMLHIVPVTALQNPWAFSVSDLRAAAKGRMLGFYVTGVDYQNNFDGVLLVSGSGREASGYVQLFRSGVIEAVDSALLTRTLVPSHTFEDALFEFVLSSMAFLTALGGEPPVLIMASLLGAEDLRLAAGGGVGDRTFGRPSLVLPEVVVDALGFDIPSTLRPVLDAVWNAGGWERCGDYDEAGRYTRPLPWRR